MDGTALSVIRAYEELRERGIVASQHGKGYFITSTDIQATMHIFVLLLIVILQYNN